MLFEGVREAFLDSMTDMARLQFPWDAGVQ